MAAYGALAAGYRDIAIYDRAPKEPDGRTAGVFYLHHHCDIPNIPSATLKTHGVGTAREYAQKLYGNPNQRTSFPEQSRFDVVYDGMYALRWLWESFRNHIVQMTVTAPMLLASHEAFDRVVSTVPLDVLYGTTIYKSVSAYIATAPADPTAAYVEYHGEFDNPLYRASAVFGREALEFIPGFDATLHVLPDYQLHVVKKVIPARCLPNLGDNILFAGRYGAWDKTCLTHDVYHRVKEWLSESK